VIRTLVSAVAATVAGVSLFLAVTATAAVPAADASAVAAVARVSVPGEPIAASSPLAAPPETSGGGPFAYPSDGTVLRIGSSSAAVRAAPGTSSSADATVTALGISIFGGEITVDSVAVRATAAAGSSGASANSASSAVTGLVALGQPVDISADTVKVPLADWGTLDVLQSTSEVADRTVPHAAKATITGLRIELVLEHLGQPAGTVIEIGVVGATAVAPLPPPVAGESGADPATPDPDLPAYPGVAPPSRGSGAPDPGGTGDDARDARLPAVPIIPADRQRDPGRSIAGAPPTLVRSAPDVVSRLTSGGYVFPVFGPASFGDTFGAYRSDIPGNWHHGEDIVAPLGTPLLAVADGTVFSVGWNTLGGWRLWLRDDRGNDFYYAHLSAYSPLAVEGARVRAGDVLGFVGNTGDADGGIPHVHFEIHPVDLLPLGYDGVVAPYPFLVAWRRAEDVSFDAGRRYVPDADLRPGVGLPRVGAYLLEINDIGSTSGLVPGSLGEAVGRRPALAGG
jgi:murein DD-endopeptidase MepM/ murein hydrolase activator NlpD